MTQSIRNFLRSGWSVGTKVPGCWRFKKKNSPSTINNHLLFGVPTAYSRTRERNREREREREGEYVRVYEQTQRDSHPQPDRTLWMQTSDNWPTGQLTTFSKFANIFKFRITFRGDVILLNYRIISHVSKIHCFYFSNQTCHRQDMNPFCLHFGFPVLIVMYSLKLSNLTWISAQRLQPNQQPTEKLVAQPNQAIK